MEHFRRILVRSGGKMFTPFPFCLSDLFNGFRYIRDTVFTLDLCLLHTAQSRQVER